MSYSDSRAGSSYVSMVFSRDEKLLVSLTAGPEQYLVVWEWSKQRPIIINPLANTAPVTQVFLNPKEDDSFCVIGHNFFKNCKIMGDIMKNKDLKEGQSSKKENKDSIDQPQYLSQCVRAEESLMMGTNTGELMFFNLNCEYKQTLSSSPFEGRAIEVLLPCSKGFLVGTTNCTVYLYERNEGDPKKPYSRTDKKFVHPSLTAKVTNLLLTQNEETLLIGLENGQLLSVAFAIEREQLNEDKHNHPHHSPAGLFSDVVQNFHTDQITGLDVCIRKSLVATCSLDKTVKVWDYIDSRLEVNQVFEEPAYSLAFHPSGYHLVVGFRDKVRLLNVMEQSLETYREL